MSTPKRYLNQQLYQMLASHYVTGLLRGRARVRFIQLMQRHHQIQAAVAFWEQRLDTLNDDLPAVAPPPALWSHLQARLQGGAPAAPAATAFASDPPVLPGRPDHWLRRLFGNLWLGGASFVTACVLAVMLSLTLTREPVLVNYVAVLETPQGQAQLVATSSKVSRQLRLDVLGDEVKAGEPLVLWARSRDDGSYYSFGTVAARGSELLTLNEQAWQKIKTAHSLLLTREASPHPQQPSTAHVASGLCVKINYDPVKA